MLKFGTSLQLFDLSNIQYTEKKSILIRKNELFKIIIIITLSVSFIFQQKFNTRYLMIK